MYNLVIDVCYKNGDEMASNKAAGILDQKEGMYENDVSLSSPILLVSHCCNRR